MAIFNFTGELQTFTIPENVCAVRIRAEGARGGNYIDETPILGGLGASIQGDFLVIPGETLSILVGGAGIDNTLSGAGGGGGSFVWKGIGFGPFGAFLNSSTLLIAAGGGGGAGDSATVGQGGPGLNTENGGNGSDGVGISNGEGGSGGTAEMGGPFRTAGSGGTPGLDGSNAVDKGSGGGGGGGTLQAGGGGGGAGISGNGGNGGSSQIGVAFGGNGGTAIILGGKGGDGGIGDGNGTSGGFGGGGGSGGSNVEAGGGGGFAGGGGGGGSFNSGTNQINIPGVREGNGIVEITLLTDPPCPDDIENTECIRVTKVYDWTLSQTQDQRNIAPPLDCVQPITDAIASGQLVTVTCTASTPHLTIPIVPTPAPSFCPPDELCCLEIGREDVTLVDGTQAHLVAIVSSIPLHFVVSANGTVICEFDSHVKVFQKDVLCAPQGTSILCRVTQIVCDAVLLNECQIAVNVSICKEIQVEAEVKLEVIAEFCRPRAAISPDLLPLPCPPVGQFPPQCPSIFPEIVNNCFCSVTGIASSEFDPFIPLDGLEIVSATVNLNICPNCEFTGSTLNGTITFLTGLGNIVPVPFAAITITPPLCNIPIPGVINIEGTLPLAFSTFTGLLFPFTLTINQNTNTALLTIDLTEALLFPVDLNLSAAGISVMNCNPF